MLLTGCLFQETLAKCWGNGKTRQRGNSHFDDDDVVGDEDDDNADVDDDDDDDDDD